MKQIRLKQQGPLLLLLLAFSFLESQAQSNIPINYHRASLPNGLQVLVIEDPTVPLVHFDMVMKFGAIAETAQTDGLAHLYEHMIFTATENYPTTKSFEEKTNELGIISNALTNEESVHYYFSISSTNWKPGLTFFSKGIQNPIFLPEEIELQKKAIKDELNTFQTDPYYRLNQATNSLLWKEEFSRKNVSGNIDIVQATSIERLKAFNSQYHHPKNALLIVAGDITEEEAIAEVEKTFGTWSKEGVAKTDPYKYSALSEPQYALVEAGELEYPALLISWQGPGMDDQKSQMAASLFFHAINLPTSQFYNEIETEDYVFDYHAGIRHGQIASTLFFEFYPDVKTTDDVMVWFQNKIRDWTQNQPITDEELAVAKRKWANETIFEEESLSEYILEIGDRWAIGGEKMGFEYNSLIQSITVDDIQKLIKEYLTKPAAFGLAIDPSKSKKLDKSIRPKFLPK